MDGKRESSSATNKYFDSDVLDPCIHCGFCLPTCASYRVLGTEMDSPRGRIHTVKAIENGEVQLDATIAHHFDTCLGCFACVSACPSGVHYDELIESIRPKLNEVGMRDPCQNLFRKLLLQVLPYPKRLRTILFALRNYSGSSFQKMLREFGLIKLFGKQLEAMEALMPPLIEASFADSFPEINPSKGPYRGRVGLVLGCVQRCFDPEVNQATLAVLQANGFEVVIPKQQGCCGAVAHHQGLMKETIELGKALVENFGKPDTQSKSDPLPAIDAVLIAASGCGHTMKAYGKLLGVENTFKVPVFDIHEFLTKKGLQKSFLESLQPLGDSIDISEPYEVAYHDPCHMIHGQKISQQPRKLLKAIPNLLIREVEEVGVCCGSAGIYNLVQPNEANELGKIKVKDLQKTGARIISSANIGCTLQIRRHLNNSLKVVHPMQLLAKSAGLYNSPSMN